MEVRLLSMMSNLAKTSPFEYKHTAVSNAMPLPIDGNYTGTFNLKLAHG